MKQERDRYVQADFDLATLLGWSDLCQEGDSFFARPVDTTVAAKMRVPVSHQCMMKRWTKSSNCAFALMVAQGCYPLMTSTGEDGSFHVTMGGAGHPLVVETGLRDPQEAVRYAIVVAVIAKLQATQFASLNN